MRPGSMEPRPRLLLVDDDADMRSALADALGEGFEVAQAANGEEGLRWLRQAGRPCAVLLDLLMPQMDGGEFLARMREEPEYAQVPVLILTGIASSQLKRLLGAEAVFVKPFDTGQLRRELERLCRRGRRQPRPA